MGAAQQSGGAPPCDDVYPGQIHMAKHIVDPMHLSQGFVGHTPPSAMDWAAYQQVQAGGAAQLGHPSPFINYGTHHGQESQSIWRSPGFLGLSFLALCTIAAVLWRFHYDGFYGLVKTGPPPPPQWALDLLPQIGDQDHLKRGECKNPFRQQVEDIFGGTRVEGYPAGTPGDEDFITWNSGKKIEGEFGPVVFSDKAAALRATLIQQGWNHRILYHGTENPFVTSILTGGFLNSDGWHGVGIYATSTFAHSQCYAPGDGESILKLEVYWNPVNQSQYFNHVPHNSLANDVYVIRDPLLVYPVELMRCCPEELTCR
mmetsp:Transcript_7278/g.26403  ORF Transcript_7278/g.26403 Transcript_7278/m.26403 type:complete len:315 (-) Transcript_7278:104-1048(-)